MIASSEKSWPSRGKTLIIITVKGRVRNVFDVKIVRLMEASEWDQKYGIGPGSGYGSMGCRVCDRHQNIFNVMSSLSFFVIVICFPCI